MSKPVLTLMMIAGGTLSVLLGAGCTERVADCVEVYANTGAMRQAGYTRIACEERCASIQGWIDCYWDGSIMTPTGPSVSVPQNRPADGR